jgi:hypothetical protein
MDTTKGFDMVTSPATGPPHIVTALCASIARLLSGVRDLIETGEEKFCTADFAHRLFYSPAGVQPLLQPNVFPWPLAVPCLAHALPPSRRYTGDRAAASSRQRPARPREFAAAAKPTGRRNLLYTGVTRGKRLVVLVGQKKAIAIAVRNVSGRRRWSKLKEWLRADALTIPA